ncbi:isochorismatase family cysteine hydrolase [Streptomyces sp. NPDC059979]|uniref:isochorismatase family cysteine hydrolase n=1 Tax=Streptomyces sp. NPDC059979 TaxID=3347021 RepID=UPI0036ABF235
MTHAVLIVIDMLNTYEHEDADALVPSVREALPAVQELLKRARSASAPVIYVNDNFGRWRSHHGELVEAARAGRHRELVDPIAPDEDSFFIVKARHSIFYETPLAYLLGQLEARHLVMCGQVTEQCILYSALDAHIRHFDVTIAPEAVAHIDPELAQAALRMMETNMSTSIRPLQDITFDSPKS